MPIERFLEVLVSKLRSINRRTMGRFPEINKAITFINKERSIRNNKRVKRVSRRLR